jgi:hypothetical protein
MKSSKLSKVVAIGVLTGASAWAAPAAAEPRPTTADRAETIEEMEPNAELIASGFFTLALPYFASVVAASASTRNGDNFLYVPVAGPWMDLSNRSDCPPVGTCTNEPAYRVLLVADGILQGFGALEMLSGFMFPVPHSANSRSSPEVTVVPRVSPAGAGITAVGRF